MISVFRTLLFAVLIAGAGHIHAQAWPEKPVRIVTAGSAGTTPDVITRLVADRLGRTFGRPFVVENLVGGAGMLAPRAVARSAPDGYTFVFGGVGYMITDRYMFKDVPYDADRDFVPVAMLYDSAAFIIAVHPDVPVKNVAELIALAKSQPGKLSYGTDIVGATALAGPWFVKVAGIDMIAVPYKSVSQMLQDAVAGRTAMVVNSLANVDALRKAGKLRVIGISAANRFPAAQDVPTIAETLPGFKIVGFGLLSAPAGTPAGIIQRLNREIDLYVREPEYVQRLLSVGITNSGAGTPESLAEFIRNEREIWDKIMKGMDVHPQ